MYRYCVLETLCNGRNDFIPWSLCQPIQLAEKEVYVFLYIKNVKKWESMKFIYMYVDILFIGHNMFVNIIIL